MNTNKHIKAIPRMFEQVTQQIIDHIESAHLEPGQKLPTERQLSELLQVSRSSVREGIKVLELLRYLESKQGEGTFVSSPPPFLIPSRVIHKSLSSAELTYYFEVMMMCAQTIVTNFFMSEEFLPNDSCDDSFWQNFAHAISYMGEKISNPYFLSLWNESFFLLIANEYFSRKQPPFDWIEFSDAIYKKDLQKAISLLQLLDKEV
ncbi:FadR/GntR family transcriptional regulator [Ammoniphilus sp. 3BR4]|uniref:FadR/GntR family transcriptional regulator n=1 Tax=Ammoniphilus sp. 3BR4 TaxID=3158265 RepID=UPI003466EB5C